MNGSLKRALGMSFLVLAAGLKVQAVAVTPSARYPVGLYALVPLYKVIHSSDFLGAMDKDTYLQTFYTGLLDNQAVAGLAIQAEWKTLNDSESASPSWGYVQDAFISVDNWNIAHAFLPPKNIQLLVSPGYYTPDWVMDKLGDCDAIFSGAVKPGCGRATFTHADKECAETDCNAQLPLPWDTKYIKYWSAFVNALAVQFASNPDLVSIAVGGPTAASAEMTLPHDKGGADADTTSNCQWMKLLLNEYGSPAPATCPASGMPPWPSSATWPPPGTSPDQPFIDEWNAAIDMYATAFSGLTLVATTGSGLPDFPGANPSVSSKSFATLLSEECPVTTPSMDCAAETAILYHFVQPGAGGINNKATQSSGIYGCKTDPVLGMIGVRNLTQATMTMTGFTTLILGGGQFNSDFTEHPGQDQCSNSPSTGQAILDALTNFFTGTEGGFSFGGGGTVGTAPLNYLQVYYEDIPAAATTAPPLDSIQYWLDMASNELANVTSEPEPMCAPGATCIAR